MADRNSESRTGLKAGRRGQGGELNEGAPTKSQQSTIRDAKHPDEKPDPSTVAQVEELK